MSEKIFKGVGVALVTPFKTGGEIDEEGLRMMVSHLIAHGADFITVLGTTAESATMTPQEREFVVKCVADENKGRLPLLLGLGGNCTSVLTGEVASCSSLNYCQGILSVVPFYNKPSQEGMFQHFKAVAASSKLPVVLYNVPGRTGVNMTAETTIRLAESCPNIIGIKEATGNMQQATDLLKLERKDFSILSGEDGLVMPLVAMGFDGVISVAANLVPQLYSKMIACIKAGDVKAAAALHIRLSDFCVALFKEGNPCGIKAALLAAGLIKSQTLRLPLVPVSDALYDSLAKIAEGLQTP